MLSKVISASFYGIEGYLITVEVDVSGGLPSFSTVGLPGRVVSESKERITSAIKNSGIDYEVRRTTINLAPADIKKEGAGFDLPIAIGILAAHNLINHQKLNQYVIIGELALDGFLRRVKGVLPVSLAVKSSLITGIRGIILPASNAEESAIVGGIEVIPVKDLRQTIRFLNGEENIARYQNTPAVPGSGNFIYELDFSEIKGQDFAKRAIEVASAGAHNVVMIGPPGAGKTMLACRIPTILPPMVFEEALETTKIHSVAGKMNSKCALVFKRPFVSPHHTISSAALTGGGTVPRPGEISLSHNGVLFLDELPEFHRDVIEALRQPLEKGEVTVSRVHGAMNFPANFMLVAALNPCPCGYSGSAEKDCTCSSFQIRKYLSKISGPILDRIDIHLEVPALKVSEIVQDYPADLQVSTEIRKRVEEARKIQMERLVQYGIYTNSRMNSRLIRKFCAVSQDSKSLLKNVIEKLGLSARSYDKILKVARTISDLDGRTEINVSHISEAIQYRCLDRLM